MCTAATYKTKDFYFGRTLDYEFSYGDEITVTPRKFPFEFRHMGKRDSHYAIIGMAHVAGGYPLYYDAINEKGVGMAGLNFVGNAVYQAVEAGRDNVAQFEFIPWILGQCADLDEVRALLDRMNLVGTPFSEQLPSAQLHWIIADRNAAITVECMADGMHIHENPVGVLTNNPPFETQMFLLNNYQGLSPKQPENTFAEQLQLQSYSRGMGALGLPGDLSSASRFAKVAFTKMNSKSGDSEAESIASSSIFSDRSISSVDAVKWQMANMRSHSILPAVMQIKEFIIIQHTTTTRSQVWICTIVIWTVPSFLDIHWFRENRSTG